MGIHLLLDPGTAGGMLAGVAWGLGIDGPSTGVPAITGKQPGAGFFPQAPPVCAEFVEQNGTEHYVAVLATLAALDVITIRRLSMSVTFNRVNSSSRTPVA